MVTRYPILDIVRGLTVLAMIAYHFCYDLVYFQWVYFDFQVDLFWKIARISIVSSFLLIMGISLQIAHHKKFTFRTYLRRILLLAACAALISVSTTFLFGDRFIFFGILHFITAASLLAVLFIRFYYLNIVLGALLIVLGVYFQHTYFDHAYWQWLGLMTFNPSTEDYVPLLPWLGVVLWGLAIGHKFCRIRVQIPASTVLVFLQQQPGHLVWRLSQVTGRHALAVYMLHQPLLIGVLGSVNYLFFLS